MRKVFYTCIFLACAISLQAKPNKHPKVVSQDSVVVDSIIADSVVVDNQSNPMTEDTLLLELKAQVLLLEHQKDSLQNVYTERLAELQSICDKHIAARVFADTCMVQAAWTCCKEPYHPRNVRRAISYEKYLYSDALREQQQEMFRMLRSYQKYDDGVQQFLVMAQNDPLRKNRFADEDYKNKYLNMLRSVEYYDVYLIHLKDKKRITLPYLDNLIGVISSRLQSHSSSNIIDFTDLIH